MSTTHPVNAPDAVSRLMAHVRTFDSRSYSAGKDYFARGRVRSIEQTDDQTVVARVNGTRTYEVQLTRLGTTWWCDCSCPVGQKCKHIVAAALAWQKRISGGPLAATDDTDESGALISNGKTPSFRAQWQPVLESKLGRALTPSEGAFLGKISQVFHNFKQLGVLWPNDVLRLGFETKQAQVPAYTRMYEGWWTQPPSTPLELWQYIAVDIESSGLKIPEFMAPLTDVSKVRPSVESALRLRAAADWMRRFRANTEVYPNSADEARSAFLDLRIQVVGRQIELQSRPSAEAPWKGVSGAVFKRLCEADSLAQIEAAHAVLACLMLIKAYHDGDYTGLSRSDIIEPRLLNQILRHPRAKECVVRADGLPFHFQEEPLTWKIVPTADATEHYTTVLTLAGSDKPLNGLLPLPGRPNLYLDETTVYRGPPPFAEAGERVPREAIEDPEILQRLHAIGAGLPVELLSRFESVSLQVRFECELDDEEHFVLFKLVANSAKPKSRIQRVWTSAGWEDAGKRGALVATRKEKVRIFEYIQGDVAVAALKELDLIFQPYTSVWTGRFNQSFIDQFIAWRARLPKEIEVVGTGEIASLLKDPIRGRLDFSLIATKANRDWFDLAVGLRTDDDTLTPAEIALLLKARGRFVRLEGKGWRRLTVEFDEAAKEAAASIGLDAAALSQAGLDGEKHRFHLLQISQSKVAELLPERQAAQLRSRAAALVSPEPPPLPEGLKAELRPYQAEGFRFLAFLSANRLGGILADDMGLGKTLQTLTWLLWLFQSAPAKEAKCVLVVCPKSVMGNWETETARFAPSISVLRFTPALVGQPLPESTERPLVVVANYTQLRLNETFFQSVSWKAVVLDEGQFIKNPASKVAQIARELPGEQRLVLTGTPIENRLLDLWSLFAFAVPGLLGTQASFRRQFEDTDAEAVARLRRRVRHFLLRRTKSQVATDLPARAEEDVPIELEGEQLQLYQAELKNARAQLLKIKSDSQLDKMRFNILASLLRLRQICCHPALIDPTYGDKGSAKMDALMERVEELQEEGHQVLVFSQFVEMLKLIQQQLTAAKIRHLLLTGQTEDRDTLVKQFQTDKTCTVFLLSLKAAGFGLNLTAASYVILYDPWWNPAVEAQAIDRTHRIGQVNAVNAYRFVARGTVEEKIRALQKEKSALAGAVVQEESLSRLLDLETLRQVLL